MPSTNQSGAGSKEYDNDAKKMLATKNDLTIAALIRGIRKPERAREYVNAEIELAEEEDRDPRKDVVGACNRKITALTPDGEDEDTVDVDVGDGEDADTDTSEDDSADDTPDPEPEEDGEDDEDPYPEVTRFDTVDALEQAVADHEHDDAFTTAKPAGTLAGCFKCQDHIGFVPRDG